MPALLEATHLPEVPLCLDLCPTCQEPREIRGFLLVGAAVRIICTNPFHDEAAHG